MARSPWITPLWRPLKNSRRKQQRTLRDQRLRPQLEALEDRTLLSANVYLVNLAGDVGTKTGALSGDLRYCINQADQSANAGSTITFDTKAIGSNTITLSKGELAIADNMTVQGPGASSLAVNGNKAGRVFDITSSTAVVSISGLTISGGSANAGGGIYNKGALTVSDCTLSDNTAQYGGAIETNGSLTLTNSTLSANTATVLGGAIQANGGTLIVSNGSVLSGNSAHVGGGILSGFVYNVTSTAILTNDTIVDNSASISGGIFIEISGKVLLHNTLIAGNSSNIGGSISDTRLGGDHGSLNTASDYNLVDDGSGGLSAANHNLLGSATNLLDPLLAPLSNYGGPTQTMALLPGSPAIDAGSSAYGGSTDQRGKPRVGATDIGAFESQGFTIAVSSGNNQSAAGGTAFANPLVVSVKANSTVEPVAGGLITFTAPSSGASATFSPNPATAGSNGQASVTATANGTVGTYTVSGSTSGVASPANFSLTNTTAQTTYDAVRDFSAVANPNGVWSYLYEQNGSGPQLLENHAVFPQTELIDWWDGNQIPYSVTIIKNTTGSTISYETIQQPPNLLNLDPESYTAITRWAAPSTGTWNISGLFQGIDTNEQAHPVEILENSSTVLLSPTSIASFGQQVPFSDTVALNKGDTIDFMVLTGATTYGYLSTGLSATITAPASGSGSATAAVP